MPHLHLGLHLKLLRLPARMFREIRAGDEQLLLFFQGLFTGFTPTMIEDVPDMAFKFAAYESMRQMHANLTGRKANPTEDFAMGAVSGAVAAAATTPLDVIKTNMMCNAGARPSMVCRLSSAGKCSLVLCLLLFRGLTAMDSFADVSCARSLCKWRAQVLR